MSNGIHNSKPIIPQLGARTDMTPPDIPDINTDLALLREHTMACFFFKKQLELAWEQNNLQAELSAYDNLSLEYFYLGELEKAHYYHDRIIRG